MVRKPPLSSVDGPACPKRLAIPAWNVQPCKHGRPRGIKRAPR